MRQILRGGAAALLLLGTGLIGTADFLPVRPAVAEPPEWLDSMWVVLPALLLIVGGLAVSAARAFESRTRGFRVWCGVLAVVAVGTGLWAWRYAAAAWAGGLPVLAPFLFALGFAGVAVGAVVLIVTGPAVDAESSSEGAAPPELRRSLVGVAAGAIAMGTAAAVCAGVVTVGPVEAVVARRVDLPAVPENPDGEAWAWKPPEGQHVAKVVAAGAGVVALVDDGVVALDGAAGTPRWQYRRLGAEATDLVASPGGERVMVSFASSADGAEGARVLAFDAMTGEVGFDRSTDGGSFGGVRLLVTDDVLIGGHGPASPLTTIRGYDLRTGKRRWEYHRPERCRWSSQSRDPVPVHGAVLLGLACGPDKSRRREVDVTMTLLALDDRTGKEKWRLERTLRARSGSFTEDDEGRRWWQWGRSSLDQFVQAGEGGNVVRFGWTDSETEEDVKAAYIVDVAAGKVLADRGLRPKERLVEFREAWLMAGVETPKVDSYRLYRIDGTKIGSARLPDPDSTFATCLTERALVRMTADSASEEVHRVKGTVEIAAWSGGPVRHMAVDLGRIEEPGYGFPHLTSAPGAIVVWYEDSTRVVGIR